MGVVASGGVINAVRLKGILMMPKIGPEISTDCTAVFDATMKSVLVAVAWLLPLLALTVMTL